LKIVDFLEGILIVQAKSFAEVCIGIKSSLNRMVEFKYSIIIGFCVAIALAKY
jgi:hypothetical protein